MIKDVIGMLTNKREEKQKPIVQTHEWLIRKQEDYILLQVVLKTKPTNWS